MFVIYLWIFLIYLICGIDKYVFLSCFFCVRDIVIEIKIFGLICFEIMYLIF